MTKVVNQKQILNTVKKTVAESVQGVLRDPDYGLEIKDSYKKKLEDIHKRKATEGKTLKMIKQKYDK